MADTPRTKAQLIALYPDNTTGQISPQDLRDFVESMHLPFGEMYISTPASTTVTNATFQKLNGTTALGEAHLFDMPASNRLRYTGAVTRKFHVTVATQMNDSSGDPKQYRVYHYDDSAATGATVAKSEIDVQGTASPINSPPITLQAIIEMATNDYLELHAAAPGTGGTNVTIESMNFVAKALFG